MKNALTRVVDSPAFAAAVLAVILANAVVLSLQTYRESCGSTPSTSSTTPSSPSMEEARELERRPPISPDEVAPVAERIAILRSALDELERELNVRDLR